MTLWGLQAIGHLNVVKWKDGTETDSDWTAEQTCILTHKLAFVLVMLIALTLMHAPSREKCRKHYFMVIKRCVEYLLLG